jgi:arylsulfatase A-like enzyme
MTSSALRYIGIVSASILAIAAMGLPPEPAKAPPAPDAAKAAPAVPPNFVFILVDDQAWNGTSVPMIPGDASSKTASFRMPNLDALAARGMTFSQAYASHCKCECSRASIITGRTTASNNCVDKGMSEWKTPAADSMVNSLKRIDPSYRAAHLGKWQWRNTPASLGFDVSDGITQNETGDSPDPLDPKRSFGITKRAHEFMGEQVKSGHPFYLQLSYYAPHQKPQALATTLAKYEGHSGDNGAGKGAGKGAAKGGGAVMAAMTEDLDTCIGSVLKDLETLGIAGNTYVIYMSDNGGRTGVLQGGKTTLWEGGIRVPLIVAGPGVKAGNSKVPVVSYDLLPTILDLAKAGTAPPKGVEGGSWKPVLQKGSDAVARPIDRLVWHMPVEVDHPQSAMRQGDWKLLYYWDTKQAQLFDLSKDMREAHDLSSEQADRTKAMLAVLREHIRAGLGEGAVAALDRGEKSGARGGPGGPGGKGAGGRGAGGKGGGAKAG